jgi:hypothetical protein
VNRDGAENLAPRLHESSLTVAMSGNDRSSQQMRHTNGENGERKESRRNGTQSTNDGLHDGVLDQEPSDLCIERGSPLPERRIDRCVPPFKVATGSNPVGILAKRESAIA